MHEHTGANIKSHMAALVLAAGDSKRFGRSNKLLADFNGGPLLSQTLDCVARFGAGEIVVVSGCDQALIRDVAAPLQAKVVFNERFADGMGTSIAVGVRALSPSVTAVAICLGDMPCVKATTFDELARRFAAAPDPRRAIVVPRFAGRRGHPVIFGQDYFQALSNASGDQGARQNLQDNHDQVIDADVDDPGIHRDFDTRADFDRG